MSIELSRYDHFVESVTSKASRDLETWIEQLRSLEDAGVNAALLTTAGIGLAGEAGEFDEIVKKLNFHGKEYNDEVRAHMIKELGDVVFYWTMACQAIGVTPDEVVAANVDKLQNRYPGGFSIERANNKAADDI